MKNRIGGKGRCDSRLAGARGVNAGYQSAQRRGGARFDLAISQQCFPYRKIFRCEIGHGEGPILRAVGQYLGHRPGRNAAGEFKPGYLVVVALHRGFPFRADAQLGQRAFDTKAAACGINAKNLRRYAAGKRSDGRSFGIADQGHCSQCVQEIGHWRSILAASPPAAGNNNGRRSARRSHLNQPAQPFELRSPSVSFILSPTRQAGSLA